MSPRISDERKERRDQLLDAAARCFLRKGYAATTVQDILAESALSTGALYLYFSSKDELYAALLERNVKELIAWYRVELPQNGSAWERLRRLIHRHFGSFAHDRQEEITRLYLLDFLPASAHETLLREQVRRRNQAIHDLFKGLLLEGVEIGEFHRVDPDVTAALILAAGDGVRLHALTAGTLADAERMFESFVRNLHSVLFRRTETRTEREGEIES